eukprot:1411646-Rhodomonas_salina.1
MSTPNPGYLPLAPAAELGEQGTLGTLGSVCPWINSPCRQFRERRRVGLCELSSGPRHHSRPLPHCRGTRQTPADQIAAGPAVDDGGR